MILVIDDDRPYADSIAEAMKLRGYEAISVYTTSSALSCIKDPATTIDSIVLDIMMPAGSPYSQTATGRGRYTGMQLFATIRAVLPDVPIFVTTILRDEHIIRWFMSQRKCNVCLKPFHLDDLLAEIDKALARRGKALAEHLRRCPPGWDNYREYEALCVDILRFLFVPPLPDIVTQARTANSHEVRDALLVNHTAGGFWAQIRREFASNNVPCEFKNHRRPIGAREARQMRIRLDKPSLGRFGMVLSRLPAGGSARKEQRNAYTASPRKLILFLDDATLEKMMRNKDGGDPPEAVLQELKTQFEVEF